MPQDQIAPLDWPRGYGSPKRKPAIIFGIPFLSIGTLFFGAMLIAAVSAGNVLQIIFHAGGTVVSASAVAALVSVWSVRPTRLPRKTTTDSALVLPMARPFSVSLLVLLISGAVFLVAYAISLLVRDDRSSASNARDYAVAGMLIVTVIATALLAFHYITILRSDCKLAIGPECVELNNGSIRQVLDWSEISDVEASANYNNPVLLIKPSTRDSLRILSSSFVVRRLSPQYLRNMTIDVHFFRIDPALLYHLIRFYWQHPEARHELASEAATDRIQRGELTS
ncbi:hypothetical protein [Nocardia wallacei]|uniref:Uncharacterized protein n=1 Tax=Nocardia wallacei TaxID=480035 RepID=A0A7G1KB93_9NOCA|nr:hypothetical protein [Nocardia wallacei]BCK52448.1 hypothetical protein NWFMUON74_02200 [Nocardia wallacei]